MNRQSTANRTVYAASGQSSQNTNALALARLLEKKKEINAVMALENASQLCVKRLEALGQDYNVMADSGEVFGQVLEQWLRMFDILQLFVASRSSPEEDQEADDNTLENRKLVRVPLDRLQESSQTESS